MSEQLTRPYIIGTRGSLLALTQCNQVKQELEEITGNKFELKIIKTQGDMDTSKPLWQMEGKDFFTKELDQELLEGSIDLVVHSYKDLGSDRPEGIELAAITKRQFAHDILFLRKDVIQKLSEKKELIIGTSSPRRIYNLEKSLSKYIPYSPKIKTKQLRGNVNTRLKKCADGKYDGVCLAFAGIERLALNKESIAEVKPHLDLLNYMILPLSTFPSAASQGALGIEINNKREDNDKLLGILKNVHCPITSTAVSKERKIFQRFGGGCHLAVGINSTTTSDGIIKTSVQGISDNKEVSYQVSDFEKPEKKGNVFIGISSSSDSYTTDELTPKKPLIFKELKSSPKYITRVFDQINLPKGNLIFCSGTRSMKKLAAQGLWVNGCSDSLGETKLLEFKNSALLNFMTPVIAKKWDVLSHSDATTDLGVVVPSYKMYVTEVTNQFKEKISNTNIFYWTSFRQFEAYLDKFPEIRNKTHCCGLGKTYQQSKRNGFEFIPFSGMKEFKFWCKGK
jgi:hydroxymethylbilane synthase